MNDKRKILADRVRLLRAFTMAFERIPDYWNSGVPMVYSAMRYGIGREQYVSFSQEKAGRVSYARCADHVTDNTRRIRTTFARYVRRQLKLGADVITDQTLQVLASCIMGHCLCGDGFVETVRGADITKAYRAGFGGRSCMTGDCARYIELYALNPGQVSLVKYSNGTTARALLWTCDDGTTYLDRIYPTDNGPHVESLRQWAERQGYKHRVMGGTSGLRVTLDNTGDYWPYCDTFTTCDDTCDGVVLRADYGGDYQLDSTCGERGDGGYACDNCGCRVHEEDICSSAQGDCYCSDCYCDIYTSCAKCGEETFIDDAVTVDGDESWCEYCARSHAVQCEDCGDHITDDYLIADDTSRVYCSSCAEHHITQCEECGECHETTETVDDNEYCETCADDMRADVETALSIYC